MKHFFLLTFALCITISAQDRVQWHHGASPWRAVFEITSPGNHQDAGAALQVPVCGLGPENGEDVIVYDQRGVQLPAQAIGSAPMNRSAVLVKPHPETTRLFAYFGSKTRAPQNTQSFLDPLTVEIKEWQEEPLKDWQVIENGLEQAQQIALDFAPKIQLTCNPVDSQDTFAMVFEGNLNIHEDSEQTFFIVTDDAGFLLIDDELVISREGRRYVSDALRGEFQTTLQLKAGPHKVKLVVLDAGGDAVAVLGRWISSNNRYILRESDFIQPARTKLLQTEARHRDQDCPAFDYEIISYMSYNRKYFTEIRAFTLNSKDARWSFEDGFYHTGSEVRRIIPGLENVKIKARMGRNIAYGKIRIPENAPRRLLLKSRKHYARYTKLIEQFPPERLDLKTLQGYADFFRYKDYNPAVGPIAEAITLLPSADPGALSESLFDLARATGTELPVKADKAYNRLINLTDHKSILMLAGAEYIEFLLFRRNDPDAAEIVLSKMKQNLHGVRAEIGHLEMDINLQRGNLEKARSLYEALLSGQSIDDDRKHSVVRANAMRERFYDLLEEDFLINARKKLHNWMVIAPEHREDGSFQLARARLWKRLGWYKGAIRDLNAAIAFTPLLPNLPDIEYEKALIYKEAGQRDEYRKQLKKVIEYYPNHPAAASAKKELTP